jgi:F-box-like
MGFEFFKPESQSYSVLSSFLKITSPSLFLSSIKVEMSVLCNQSDNLNHDVLLMIFRYLDGKDLLHCEAVCRQWREVMLMGTPWRRWLDKQRTTSSGCSQFWPKLRLAGEKLVTRYSRAICLDLLRYLKALDHNWRKGWYQKRSLPKLLNGQAIYSKCPQIGRNHIAYWFQLPSDIVGINFLDKTSLEVTGSFTIPAHSHLLYFDQSVAIFQQQDKIKFISCDNGQVINEVVVTDSSSELIDKCCCNGKLLAVRKDSGVDIWRVEISTPL